MSAFLRMLTVLYAFWAMLFQGLASVLRQTLQGGGRLVSTCCILLYVNITVYPQNQQMVLESQVADDSVSKTDTGMDVAWKRREMHI